MPGLGDYEEEELEDENDEEALAAERGEVCADCGEEFTESNGKPALCQECFESYGDRGVEPPLPLSKHPVV
jgi:formylmethanofuran dehydrogenase subunit E